MDRGRHGRTSPTSASAPERRGRARQRAMCIAAVPSGEELAELEELLRTAGVAIVGKMIQHRQRPHADSYLGSGKLVELRAAAEAADANLIACDDELTPRQERSLERALELPVVDRTAVILDIFAGHAQTAEGKLQVELAQLEYNLARMRGLWTHLERLGGGIGTRGPGEAQIETDRRLARDRIGALRERVTTVRSSRAVMRAERERTQLPAAALAGYTNAGKSTLLNALTGADAGVGDRLFHTLDPSTRTMTIDSRTYLLTDTVGFIRKLPHQLVDAFSATLEETRLADVIVHVVDASAPERERQDMLRAVNDVLDEIGAGTAPQILVLNKADLLDEDALSELAFSHRAGVLVSARTGAGLDELRARIADQFHDSMQSIELLVPYTDGNRLAELHELAGDLERHDTADGVRVVARLPATVAARYERFAVGRGNGAGARRARQ